jgi:hypothetical protein
VASRESRSAWFIFGGRDGIEFAMESTSYCNVCGAKVDHVPTTPPIALGTMPKPGPALWTSEDGSLIASPAVAEVLSAAGNLQLASINDDWTMICGASLAVVTPESERFLGDACQACWRHTADLLRPPVVLEPLQPNARVLRTAEVYGEGAERGPMWVLSSEARSLLDETRQRVILEPIRVRAGRA